MALHAKPPPGVRETIVYRGLGVLSEPRAIHGLEIEMIEFQATKPLWIKIGLGEHKL